MGRITTDDLARYLNLSRSTVSKALNDHPSVAESTKRAVLKAAYQFGYMDYPTLEEIQKGEEASGTNGVIGVLMTTEPLKDRLCHVALDGMVERDGRPAGHPSQRSSYPL